MALPQPALAAIPTAAAPPASSKTAQIRVAAGRLFLEHGYGATSMDAVARAAGVSKATLYAHFTNKADLFSAIVAAECARAVPMVACQDVGGLPVAEALFRIGRTLLDLLLSADALSVYRVVVAESPRFPELGRAFYQAGPMLTLGALATYLEGAHRRGELTVPDPTTAAELFWGMIRSHAHLRCLLFVDHAPDVGQRDRHVRSVVDVFVRGFTGSGRIDGQSACAPLTPA
jgi:AcrR family transcriptional regulator